MLGNLEVIQPFLLRAEEVPPVPYSILTIRRTRPASSREAKSPAHHRAMNQAHCCCLLVKAFIGGFSPENEVRKGLVSKNNRQTNRRADEQ